jgi:hypothetical protein
VKRTISSDIVEQWMTHLRLQRTRARDMVWLIEHGATLHDGRKGEPMTDATQRWLREQRDVIAEVDRMLVLYDSANADHPVAVHS